MATPIDYEKFMPRGYTLVRATDWVIRDPAVGTNVPIGVTGPVDIYVTWEGETELSLDLIPTEGDRRTLATGKKYVRYTLGAREGDRITITATSIGFPASDSHLRGTLKILPMVSIDL